MEGIREYLLSVTAAALLCGIVQSFVGEKGSTAGILRLICGIFLCCTVMRPVVRIQLGDFADLTSEILLEANSAASEGADYARQAKSRLIKEEAEAYILDKARVYGAHIRAEVTLTGDDPPMPQGCVISGAVSPYARQQLMEIMESELGIPEENVKWIQ